MTGAGTAPRSPSGADSAPIFLTAEWRHLVMANFEIEPAELRPFVPAGTELDSFGGPTLISLVGFMFLRTRLRGVPVLCHRRFEEVNLRFYVRREGPEGPRRGVVFIREIVPKRAVAALARRVYNEPYIRLPMKHEFVGGSADVPGRLRYEWRLGDRWCHLAAEAAGALAQLLPNSESEFITEHFWGYTRQRDGSTKEYRVEHPSWRVSEAQSWSIGGDVAPLYGETFAAALRRTPRSVLIADGSEVIVRSGRSLRTAAGRGTPPSRRAAGE